MPQWDAALYLKFSTERTQPSIDLIQRIALADPRSIVDLGCGPGNSTEALRRRWPGASITGLDSSKEMIRGRSPGVSFGRLGGCRRGPVERSGAVRPDFCQRPAAMDSRSPADLHPPDGAGGAGRRAGRP